MVSDPAPPPEPVDPGMVRHFTATGYVVNPTRTRMLLIHHRKLGGVPRVSRTVDTMKTIHMYSA
jgi:hypothetical protein